MKFSSVIYKGLHTAIPLGTGPSMRYACVTMCQLPAMFTADLSAMGAIKGKNFLPALSIFNERNSLLWRSRNIYAYLFLHSRPCFPGLIEIKTPEIMTPVERVSVARDEIHVS